MTLPAASKTACPASHAAAKADDSLWAELLPIGVQPVPAFMDPVTGEYFPAYRLALANCRCCGSTLAKQIDDVIDVECEVAA